MPTQQEIANALAGIRAKYQGAGPNAEALALQAMSDYAAQNGLNASMLSGPTGAPNSPSTPW